MRKFVMSRKILSLSLVAAALSLAGCAGKELALDDAYVPVSYTHLAQTMPFLVATVFAGGILAAAVALWSMFMAVVDIHGPNEDAGLVKVARKIKPKLPYGFALAVGAIVTYPHTWWMAGGA